MTLRKRADILLVERGYFVSRAKAREAIEAGLVAAGGVVVRKPSDILSEDADIVAERPYPYVSRGGVKLAAALETFRIDPAGLVCLDIGASTGGFTDVLLRGGASHVYAVDVGHGQLDAGIALDERITPMEKTDARTLAPAHFTQIPQLAVFDVSFISLRLVLPSVLRLLAQDAACVALIKPQFEAGRENIAKGIVRDPALHEQICTQMRAFVEELGWRVLDIVVSPIEGGDGNREFLIGATRGSPEFVRNG